MQLCSWIFKLCSSCAVGFSLIFQIISVQLYFKIEIAVKNCSNYPPRIHQTLPTTPFQIALKNCSNYPPSNSPNFTDYIPFQIAMKNCSNSPRRIHRTLPTTPLPNRPEKLLQLSPPSNSPNFTDYPPSKSPWKTAPTTPRRIHQTLPTPPLPNISPVEFTGLCAAGKNP